MPILAWFAICSAFARTFVVQNDSALTADPVLFPNGVGAPSVAWAPLRGQYLMAFETEVTAPVGCAEAWAVGIATSPDGVTFTPLRKLLAPGTAVACGARSPSLIVHDDGTLALFVQALDASSDDGVAVLSTVTGSPVFTMLEDLRGLYEPSAARLDGEWSVMGVDPAQGLVVARSTDLLQFTFDPAPELPTGVTPWSADGMMSPSVGCVDDATFPWEIYFGGYAGADTGWAWAVSTDTGSWYVSSSITLWTDDSAWKSFDFVSDGVNTAVYYEWLDANGVPVIGMTLEGTALVTADVRGRDCQP